MPGILLSSIVKFDSATLPSAGPRLHSTGRVDPLGGAVHRAGYSGARCAPNVSRRASLSVDTHGHTALAARFGGANPS
jgi:hypothetical protein